ncbi:uncharacterized protein SOCE26_099690 [Sorangium cellulosum]|uniref:Uncharacterized protein n=1 Tax=Sorangium cellulosum TaxID=56 RepID=A0A2L0FA25_SORCE|nr:barstar family protein [Sorangium cellulosum]AUX48435.1 uncharacterized protein SOCE26_099690 [Sorangium cellulosum]
MDSNSANFEGLWRQLSRMERVGWLTAAYVRWFACASLWPTRPSGEVIELDGRWIDGLESFFCAIGEAVNGAAGYFGKSLNGLADCAAGGFGIIPPWTLRWHYSKLARDALGYEETLRYEREQYDAEEFPDEEARLAAKQRLDDLLARRGPTLFDTIVSILQERGVVVELL